MAKRNSIHYVNNAEFSQAVVDYCSEIKRAKKEGQPKPQVPRYIADCFYKICEGLSHKDNFIRYSFREDMVMDAVENCLRAVENFKVDASTRSGNANAFSYFTQIAWFAFIRRIAKEKRQQDIKLKFIQQSGIIDLIADVDDPQAAQAIQAYVDQLRDKMDKGRESVDDTKTAPKERKKRVQMVDSDLQDLME